MSKQLTFTATGDSIITRRVSDEPSPDFTELVSLIRDNDVAFTNLEIMTPDEPWIPSSEYGGSPLAAAPFVLDELQWCGFNIFNAANNHSTDYTFVGLQDTIRQLNRREMTFAGVGRNLGEARAPAYREINGSRVALVACASSYVVGALAAHSRQDMDGRPGLSPLRYHTRYMLDKKRLDALKELDEALGTADWTRRRRAFGMSPDPHPDVYNAFDRYFYEGDSPEIRTEPNDSDMREINQAVAEARRQADFVVVSLHGHEGQNMERNTDEAADFMETAARSWIDNGADVVVMHGSHQLRGIEIYKGKPIFYSLANFMFMSRTITKLPAEVYSTLGLPADGTPADFEDLLSYNADGSPRAFHADNRFWRSVLPTCTFEDGVLTEMLLHPIELNLESSRTRQGLPELTGRNLAEEILDLISKLSEPYGTKITRIEKDGRLIGKVQLASNQ